MSDKFPDMESIAPLVDKLYRDLADRLVASRRERAKSMMQRQFDMIQLRGPFPWDFPARAFEAQQRINDHVSLCVAVESTYDLIASSATRERYERRMNELFGSPED